MSRLGCVLAVLGSTALGAACGGGEDSRLQHPPSDSGVEIVLSETEQVACEVDVVPSGVRFQSDPDLAIPDITQVLTRLPDGRYLSTTEAPGVVAEWDSGGQFVRTFGQYGDGPEEFGLIQAILSQAPHPVRVLHRPSITTLDSAIEISSRDLVPAITSSPTNVLLLGDGGFVYQGFHPEAPIHLLHVLDAQGTRLRSFREVDEEEMGWTDTGMSTARFEGQDAFWVGPTQRTSGEWRLEQWTPDGEMLRVIRRQAEWLESPRLRGGPASFYPRYSVTPYGPGILMVWMANWDHRNSSPDQPLRRLHWDFIDVDRGTVLASQERDISPGGPERMDRFFPNQRSGAFREIRDDGLHD